MIFRLTRESNWGFCMGFSMVSLNLHVRQKACVLTSRLVLGQKYQKVQLEEQWRRQGGKEL